MSKVYIYTYIYSPSTYEEDEDVKNERRRIIMNSSDNSLIVNALTKV